MVKVKHRKLKEANLHKLREYDTKQADFGQQLDRALEKISTSDGTKLTRSNIIFPWEVNAGTQEKKISDELNTKWWRSNFYAIRTSRIFLDIAKEISEANPRKAEKLQNKAMNMLTCGATTFWDIRHPDAPRLASAYFCQNRLCPTCAKRRARKLYTQMKLIYEFGMNPETPAEFSLQDCAPIFITLSQENVPLGQLDSELDRIMEAWHTFTRRAKIKRINVGWMRSLEITFNQKTKSYHPHIHAIFFVPKEYVTDIEYVKDKNGKYVKDKNGNFIKDQKHKFALGQDGCYVKDKNGEYIKAKKKYVKDTREKYTKIHKYPDYLSHHDLMKLWRDVMNLDYDPWVNIKECYDPTTRFFGKSKYADILGITDEATKNLKLRNAFCETAKYPTKITNVLAIKDEKLRNQVVLEMSDALEHRRLVGYGERIGNIAELLRLDDPTDGDLIHTNPNEHSGLGETDDYVLAKRIYLPNLKLSEEEIKIIEERKKANSDTRGNEDKTNREEHEKNRYKGKGCFAIINNEEARYNQYAVIQARYKYQEEKRLEAERELELNGIGDCQPNAVKCFNCSKFRHCPRWDKYLEEQEREEKRIRLIRRSQAQNKRIQQARDKALAKPIAHLRE